MLKASMRDFYFFDFVTVPCHKTSNFGSAEYRDIVPFIILQNSKTFYELQ